MDIKITAAEYTVHAFTEYINVNDKCNFKWHVTLESVCERQVKCVI